MVLNKSDFSKCEFCLNIVFGELYNVKNDYGEKIKVCIDCRDDIIGARDVELNDDDD